MSSRCIEALPKPPCEEMKTKLMEKSDVELFKAHSLFCCAVNVGSICRRPTGLQSTFGLMSGPEHWVAGVCACALSLHSF